MREIYKFFFLLCCLKVFYVNISAQTQNFYQDLTHKSHVFGSEKYYRIYLPKGYAKSQTRYPVIYFFHGWGGRHYKDDNALLEYEKIAALVDKYQLILVMWDGNMDGIEPRPYNVGNHEDVKYQVQLKDYFPELVQHIDSTYRTLTDRYNRGIIGFSMGGFMSLFLAGKYPHMVSSIVSLAGSPEFFVGYPQNHTLYPVRYTFKNLEGVNVRIHNGDSDILYFLNDEVYQGALWDGFPLDYWKFHGGHMVDKPGETQVFEMALNFISESFQNPKEPPQNWTHFDLYENFDVWGYTVKSNKKTPGYITLRNVHKTGLGVYTQRWLPNGPSLENISIEVTTPPIYTPNQNYKLKMFSKNPKIAKTVPVMSDNKGCIKFICDGAGTEIGILDEKGAPDIVFLTHSVNGSSYLKANHSNLLGITLLNKGGKNSNKSPLRVSVKTNDPSVKVVDSILHVNGINEKIVLPSIKVECQKTPPIHAIPTEVKFYLTVFYENSIWTDDFLVPVMFDVPFFENVTIDDGKAVRDTSWGSGNADGIVNPGEKVMVYEGKNRLRLFYDDPNILAQNERLADEIIPAIWPDGYTLSSIIHISPDSPAEHEIECLASYEIKSYNPIERKVTWGKVRLKVKRN